MKQWYSRRRHSKVWEIERNWADGPRGVPKCRTFKEIGRRQTNPPSLPSNAAQLVTQFTTDSRARLFSACALQNLDFLTASEGALADSAAGMRSLTVAARIGLHGRPLLCRAPQSRTRRRHAPGQMLDCYLNA